MLEIGKIGKTHGYNGELKLHLANPESTNIKEGSIIEGKVNNTTVVLFSATEFTIGTSDPNNTIAGFDVVKKGFPLIFQKFSRHSVVTVDDLQLPMTEV